MKFILEIFMRVSKNDLRFKTLKEILLISFFCCVLFLITGMSAQKVTDDEKLKKKET